MTQPTPSHTVAQHSGPPPRRNFLVEFAALVVGGIITVVPASVGAVFFLNPIFPRKKTQAAHPGRKTESTVSDDGYRKIGSIAGLAQGGGPVMFQVIGTKHDAWTTYPATALGAVYVRQKKDGTFECLNARCPHLGCTVNYRSGEESYVCPCHDSAFTLEGERSNEIPPRNMDRLDVSVRNGNEVWVKFQNFRTGIAEQVPTDS